ncbi:MAG: porin family protein [Planctomycetia bacterium]|nr:porin family protein [Planctomycetia bacterium]
MDVCRVGAVVCAVTSAVIACVPHQGVAADPSFYVSGMIGSSFATLADSYHETYAGSDGSINGSLFTAGGAAGYAFQRENGRLRLEVEGRGRDDLTARAGIVDPGFSNTATWSASNGWSVLANAWRDITLTDKLALYAGGGIGGGGYDYNLANRLTAGPFTESFTASASVATFAWQAGTGVIYRLSDRVEFDVSYRFYATEQADTAISITPVSGPPPVPSGLTAQHGFSASEMLFALRVYEPFRGLRR